mgnify:CR=1 FL=1
MALDTYGQIWNRVLLRCPELSPLLAQDFVVNAFRRLAEKRRWSWLVKYGQFLAPAVYSTGLATVTYNSTAVTGSGTTWTSAMIGRQFRVGLAAPIYTITAVGGATSLTLDFAFGGSSAANVGYSIYQCFYTVPSDFHQFICLWDPSFNWQLYLNVEQKELNLWDAQRANVSNPYVVSFRDYDSTVSPPLPRYELWPHNQTQKPYPFLYEIRPADLNDATGVLPRYIRGDVLLEMALEEVALWPGPSADKRNPYYSPQTAAYHRAKYEDMVNLLELQDNNVWQQDLQYQYPAMAWAMASPLGDAAFLQSHAV